MTPVAYSLPFRGRTVAVSKVCYFLTPSPFVLAFPLLVTHTHTHTQYDGIITDFQCRHTSLITLLYIRHIEFCEGGEGWMDEEEVAAA